MNNSKLKECVATLLKDMEASAASMRELIVAMPPHDLLGYIYAQYILQAMAEQGNDVSQSKSDVPDDLINENQFLLEYVHAVLASDSAPADMVFDESKCLELFELSRKLRYQALSFAIATSSDIKDGLFGPHTADIEIRAKSTWIMMRGNRYQVLEGEFYRYALAPHNDVLKELYGVDATDIAEGFQDMADSTRLGTSKALSEMINTFDAVQSFAGEQGLALESVMATWIATNEYKSKAARRAIDDIFFGGITNVSRHTKLPSLLLEDLAYKRGEEIEFFAKGDFAGTPYRTLPARKKPLIQLGSDYYAVDPCFIRDAGYGALINNLLQRKPEYYGTCKDRQKKMSEAAFADILDAQLPNATIYQEIYYKDPSTKQWSESDTLILIDDVLFLIEAKAGAAATIASPALDFGRHARSVQDLVLKAYEQCKRFFNYLNSADEVLLYQLVDGQHLECGRVRHADYRVMVPVGLTVESFSPYSAYCKDLPQVEPLLGKHAFVSLSIDDLFVLKRILPTPGEFAHYIEVRQAVAGIRHAHLYDELDHLGAYLKRNRFDQDIDNQMQGGKVNMIIWDGMSDVIDRSFEGKDWEKGPFPTQDYPDEVLMLLRTLNATRARGWLSADSFIRDLDKKGRNDLAKILTEFRESLNQFPARYFTLSGEGRPIFVWLQRDDQQIDWIRVNDKASAASLASKALNIIGLVAQVNPDGSYSSAESFPVNIPTGKTEKNTHLYLDAAIMANPSRSLNLNQINKVSTFNNAKKVGRNDPCPCGSGSKFKKCHGR